MELEVSSQNSFLLESLFFSYSGFRLQLIAIHWNRRRVYTDTPHMSFFSCTVRMLNDVSHHNGSRT